jgi:hypothetical protein
MPVFLHSSCRPVKRPVMGKNPLKAAAVSMQAFTSGKLQIEGDVMKSQLLEKLFKIG